MIYPIKFRWITRFQISVSYTQIMPKLSELYFIASRSQNHSTWYPTLTYHDSVTKLMSKVPGSGGIRTHASEETGALNQRLRPLGHATLGQLHLQQIIQFWYRLILLSIRYLFTKWFRPYSETIEKILNLSVIWWQSKICKLVYEDIAHITNYLSK